MNFPKSYKKVNMAKLRLEMLKSLKESDARIYINNHGNSVSKTVIVESNWF